MICLHRWLREVVWVRLVGVNHLHVCDLVGDNIIVVPYLLVLLLFLTLLLRILHVAQRQRSRFSMIYAYGVAAIIFFHLLINVGMTIGLMPVIGIPLPFISYGGSSLWSFTILLFILVKLDGDRLAVLR